MKYFLYILKNKDGCFYIGVTNNTKRRFFEHQKGYGAKYTKENKHETFKQVYQEEFDNLKQARKREKQLKGWTRAKKQALIEGDKVLLKKL